MHVRHAADLLDLPGEIAKLRQADHSPAALQRMELPPHRDERFAIGGIVREHAMMFGHRVEDFGGFRQINVEKLAVEFGCIGGEQPLRFDWGRDGRNGPRTAGMSWRRCRPRIMRTTADPRGS